MIRKIIWFVVGRTAAAVSGFSLVAGSVAPLSRCAVSTLTGRLGGGSPGTLGVVWRFNHASPAATIARPAAGKTHPDLAVMRDFSPNHSDPVVAAETTANWLTCEAYPTGAAVTARSPMITANAERVELTPRRV